MFVQYANQMTFTDVRVGLRGCDGSMTKLQSYPIHNQHPEQHHNLLVFAFLSKP
jgi:hypothetical protein